MATQQEEAARRADRSGPYAAAVRWMENLSETAYAYLLLTPAMLLLAAIAFWPLIQTFFLSLQGDAIGAGFVGLENYIDILSGARSSAMPAPFLPTSLSVSALFNSALAVTLVFTVTSVIFETIIGFGQALVLNQDFRGRRWVRVAIIIPWAIPIVIQGMIFYLFFQPGVGLFVGDTLLSLGPQGWLANNLGFALLSQTPLANAQDSTFIIIVADIWKTTAFMALLILAGLQSVNRDLYDVARVAGASPWQRFKKITLPIVYPTILVAMLFRTIQAMRVYGIIEASGAGCLTVPSLSCIVVEAFFGTSQIGTAATVAFITAFIIAIVVSVYIVGYAREDM